MPTVTLASGLTLSCAHQGDAHGSAVLLLPGPTDSWRSYQPVLDHLPRELRAIAGDVVPLLDALGIERAVVAGHSGSCLVVRRVALDHPDRVRGLILEASPTTLRDDPRLVRFAESVVAGLDDPISPESVRADMVGLLVEELLRVPAHVWQEMFAGLLQYDDRTELALIEAPTLLVWGDADALVPRDMQDHLARSIPDAELLVYSGVGHTPRWEDPVRFSSDVATFARRVSRRGA